MAKYIHFGDLLLSKQRFPLDQKVSDAYTVWRACAKSVFTQNDV